MGNKISSCFVKKVVNNKTSRLPLLKLPQNAIEKVLLTMDPVDLITFSLCTNSTKRRVASLKLKKLRLTLQINRSINVEIRWPDDTIVRVFLLDANSEKWAEGDNKITEFSGPNNAVVNFGPADDVNDGFQTVGRKEWYKQHYDMRCWLEHFQKLFGERFEDIHFFPNSKRYATSLLEATIGDFPFSMVEISPECANADVPDLYKNLHSLEKLWLTKNPYDASEDFQRFIHRNFDDLGFDAMVNPTLEDLLVSNAEHICMHSTLSGQVINQFLKLWVKGSNRRMVCFVMYFPFGERPELTEVLKGIDHMVFRRQQDETMTKIKRRNASFGVLHTKIVNGFEELVISDMEH